MSRSTEATMNTGGGGGFLRKFFGCKPQRLEDSGVAAVGDPRPNHSRKKPALGSSYLSKDAAAATLEPTAAGATKKNLIPRPPGKKDGRKGGKGNPMSMSLTTTPGAPVVDEATPVTSNRKSVQGSQQKSALSGKNSITAAARLEQVVGGSAHRQGGPTGNGTGAAPDHPSSPSNFIEELEATVKEAATMKGVTNGSSGDGDSKSDRKAYPTFHTNHPMQENVKAKHKLFENAFGSPSKQNVDSTESTEDCTETSNSSDRVDDLTAAVKRIPSGDEPIVDCDNDPWEKAYSVWYRKGLLKWRPKSVVLAENGDEKDEELVSDMLRVAAAESKDLMIVDGVPPSLVKDRTAAATNEMDETALLRKYHTKPAAKACANCAKDTSLILELVRCVQCKQELYCSLFCRGNHRYAHAPDCTGTSTPQKQRPSPGRLSLPSTVVESRSTQEKLIVCEEEKKDDGIQPSLEQSPMQKSIASAPTEKNMGVSDEAVLLNNAASGILPHVMSSLSQSTDASLDIIELSASASDAFATTAANATAAAAGTETKPALAPIVHTPMKQPLPIVALYSDVQQTSSSRSSSLQKSKRAPMVSLFGSGITDVSPRRLLSES